MLGDRSRAFRTMSGNEDHTRHKWMGGHTYELFYKEQDHWEITFAHGRHQQIIAVYPEDQELTRLLITDFMGITADRRGWVLFKDDKQCQMTEIRPGVMFKLWSARVAQIQDQRTPHALKYWQYPMLDGKSSTFARNLGIYDQSPRWGSAQ
jgi:hypothetical protein